MIQLVTIFVCWQEVREVWLSSCQSEYLCQCILFPPRNRSLCQSKVQIEFLLPPDSIHAYEPSFIFARYLLGGSEAKIRMVKSGLVAESR